MDPIKSVKCIMCMCKLGKCICLIKKLITLATFMLVVFTASTCLLDKKINIKKISKAIKKVM